MKTNDTNPLLKCVFLGRIFFLNFFFLPLQKINSEGSDLDINNIRHSTSSPSNSGRTLIPGQTNHEHTPLLINIGTTYYHVDITNNCGKPFKSPLSGAQTIFPFPLPTFTTAHLYSFS